MAWTHLGLEDAAAARRYFFESVQAYTELASIRGVGLSLIGLAAAAAVDHRPDAAVRIAAAAEIYASEEGIVNVYGDNPVGRELVDRARASLAEDVVRATEAGRRLTIAETLGLARAVGQRDGQAATSSAPRRITITPMYTTRRNPSTAPSGP